MRNLQRRNRVPIKLLLPLKPLHVHENMRRANVPLHRDQVAPLDQLPRVRLALVPQRVDLRRPQKRVAQPVPVVGLERRDPPLGPRGADALVLVAGEGVLAEELDARPGEDGPVRELVEGREGRLGVVFVEEPFGGGGHGGEAEAQGHAGVPGEVLQDEGDVRAGGDAADGDGVRFDVQRRG